MMKILLRKKTCFLLAAFTIISALLLMLAIGIGFKTFYLEYRKDTLISMSKDIGRMYREAGTDKAEQFDRLSQQNSSVIYIVDNQHLVYSSMPNRKAVLGKPSFEGQQVFTAPGLQRLNPDGDESPMKEPRHVTIMRKLFNGETLSRNETNEIYIDGRDDHMRFISYVYPVDESRKSYVIVSQPLEPLEATVVVVQNFVAMCGVVWLFVAIIGSILFTNAVTRPLIHLKKLSVAMAHLDFSHKWTDTRNDEIGELGQSLNNLSDQLDTALTELKQANSELEVQLKKANEVEKMRKEFISAVSHELKTPLALIQGYAEGLDSLDVDETTRQHYCKVIHSETMKMDHLVKDLLNLSRLETGTFRIDMTEFDFRALVEEAHCRFEGVMQEKDIQFSCCLPEEMVVYADPERIDTVLSNFLSNAIDYTEKGRRIVLSAVRSGDYYTISIYNQGIQIPEQDLSRVWEPFYKVDAARTRKSQRIFGGHGLGLGIVAALLKLHHETYGVYNEPDGVTFWFTLKAC